LAADRNGYAFAVLLDLLDGRLVDVEGRVIGEGEGMIFAGRDAANVLSAAGLGGAMAAQRPLCAAPRIGQQDHIHFSNRIPILVGRGRLKNTSLGREDDFERRRATAPKCKPLESTASSPRRIALRERSSARLVVPVLTL
jgi:hypothetical protein